MSAVVEPKGPGPASSEPTLEKCPQSKSGSESGSENGARPVRRQLEKTNITKPSREAIMTSDDTNVDPTEEAKQPTTPDPIDSSAQEPRGRITKKRSFDDLTADESQQNDNRSTEPAEGHTRKRSRDVKSGEYSKTNGVRVSTGPDIEEEEDEELDKTAAKDPTKDTSASASVGSESGDEEMNNALSGGEENKAEHHARPTGNQTAEDAETVLAGAGNQNTKDVFSKNTEATEMDVSEATEKKDVPPEVEGHTSTMNLATSTNNSGSSYLRAHSAARKRDANELDPTSPVKVKAAPSQRGDQDRSPLLEGKRSRLPEDEDEKERRTPSPARSPKKRSREELDEAYQRDQKIPATDETVARRSMEEERPSLSAIEEYATKSVDSKGNTKASPTKASSSSGFANTSTTSPFKSLSSGSSWLKSSTSDVKPLEGSNASKIKSSMNPQSPFKSTSAYLISAQISSADASQSASPFGGFASSNANSSFGAAKVFGSGFSSGFGSSVSKMNSFAAPVGDIAAKKEIKKPTFGAPVEEKADDGDEDDDDDDEQVTDEGGEDDAPDLEAGWGAKPQVLQVQDANTGEEDEETRFASRGKLYQYQSEKKAWAERGVGPVKLNVKHLTDDEDESGGPGPEARLIMRAAATHKVILNATVFKEMAIGDSKGKLPNGRQVWFSVVVDGSPTPFLLKMPKEQDVTGLYNAVKMVQEEM